MKAAVITGATGAIGTALVEKLTEENVRVYVLVRPDSKRVDRIPKSKNVKVLYYGLNEYDAKASLIEEEIDDEVEVFYHLAWNGTIGDVRNDYYLQNQNVKYELDAVRLADRLNCKTFIGIGSQAEYGRVEGSLTSSTPVNPENGYGVGKLSAGYMSRLLCRQLKMRHIWVRVLSIYGPNDGEATMIISTIRKLLKGEKPSLTKGEQKWDYLYSKDAANALFLIGEKGEDNKTYCLGSGEARPLREYIEKMRDSINPDADLGFGDIPYSLNQVMYLKADISELNKDTGFVPQIPFETGISETIEWVKNNSL